MANKKHNSVDSIAVCGASRSGKSTGVVECVVPFVGHVPIVVLDAQRSLGQMFLEKMIHSGYYNVLFDDFSQKKRVLQYNWMNIPKMEDEFDQYEATQKRINRYLEILAQFRDGDIGRLVREWCEAALWLYAHQKTEKSFWHLPYVYDPSHPVHKEWVRDCKDETIKNKFANLRLLHPATRIANVSPAERLTKQVMLNAGFISRTGKGFNFDGFLQSNGVLICTAGAGADKESTSVMLSSISAKTIEYAESGKGSVLVIYDEYANFGTVGSLEIQALNTLQKAGWNGIFISQQPPEEELWDAISENTAIHWWYRAGSSQTAKVGTEDIAYSILNRDKVHHYQDREYSNGHREVIVGRYSDQERTTLVSERGVQSIPVYESSNEQMRYITKEITQLNLGERFIKNHGHVYREQLTIDREIYPWACLAKIENEKGLTRILKRSEYVTPKIIMPNSQNGSKRQKQKQGGRRHIKKGMS